MSKQLLLAGLREYLRSKPGFEPSNYATRADYLRDVRKVGVQRRDAERMLDGIEADEPITADDIVQAAKSSWGGRLQIITDPSAPRGYRFEYITGQYYCVEYRGAVAATAAQTLWTAGLKHFSNTDDLRTYLEKRYGSAIRKRWFK